MKALFIKGAHDIVLQETEKPVLQGDGDVIVKITAGAICGSDLHFLHGIAPFVPDFILGHEFIGEIESASPNANRFKIGQRVSVPAMPYCGICPSCKKGDFYCCEASHMYGWRTKYGYLGGAQAQYIRVPYANACLVPIPDSVTDKQALLIGDVISTGWFALKMSGGLTPGDDIAVIGTGPVGLATIACAKLFSPRRIIGVDLLENRLEKALQLGATDVINASKTDNVAKEIFKMTGKRGVNLAVEAVGKEETLNTAIMSAGKGGNISLLGVGGDGWRTMLAYAFYRNQNINTGMVNLDVMDRLMDLTEIGKIDMSTIITHEISLDDIVEAYDMFDKKEDNCIKVMYRPHK